MATALAFIGLAYGIYAFHALWLGTSEQREQSREYWLSQQASARKSKSVTFVGRLYLAAVWLVVLPISSPGSALVLSLLLALPLLLTV